MICQAGPVRSRDHVYAFPLTQGLKSSSWNVQLEVAPWTNGVDSNTEGHRNNCAHFRKVSLQHMQALVLQTVEI